MLQCCSMYQYFDDGDNIAPFSELVVIIHDFFSDDAEHGHV